MPRYFFAIPLPDEARDHLVAVQPSIVPGMRLLGRQELHLTLHFLGEVAPQNVEVVRKALTRVKMKGFTVAIKGVGRFPAEGQPQVLWAGVERSPALSALHHSIGNALTDAIGYQPGARPYMPHVTLARLNIPALPDAIEHYLEENKRFQIPSVLVNQFALYSSVFVNDVPLYQEETVFHLPEPG